ncbi:MAG: DUF4397 domain-containing protein [Chloroflexota bacterium]
MKRLVYLIGALALSLGMFTTAFAQSEMARVRVVHASPDAPAVDVLVNGQKAFTNVSFESITDYASLAAGTYNVKVVPAGAMEPVVINADLGLNPGTNYSVVAVGELANIEPLVLVDNSSVPAAGKAHVRFVHASPDAPAVDIAVKNGPVLFSNIPFEGVGNYLPVNAGTYDLEVRVAGTDTVALDVPGVNLNQGTAYTVYAMGLASGTPALTAVISVDATMPAALPSAGEVSPLFALFATAALAGVLVAAGMALRRRTA